MSLYTGYFASHFGRDPHGLNDYVPPSNDTITPYELGWEWLNGVGPRDRVFTGSSFITQDLKKHYHIQNMRNAAKAYLKQRCQSNCNETSFESVKGANYSLGGVPGIFKYIGDGTAIMRDAATVTTGGHVDIGTVGNLTAAYLGSYGLKFTVYDIDCCQGLAEIDFEVNNSSTLQSGIRPPVIGYQEWYRNSVGEWINDQVQTGSMSRTTQKFTWTENFDFDPVLKCCPKKKKRRGYPTGGPGGGRRGYPVGPMDDPCIEEEAEETPQPRRRRYTTGTLD